MAVLTSSQIKMRWIFGCSHTAFVSPYVLSENMYVWPSREKVAVISLTMFYWPIKQQLPWAIAWRWFWFAISFTCLAGYLVVSRGKHDYNSHCSQLMDSHSRALSDGTCKTFIILVNICESSQTKEKQGLRSAVKEISFPIVLCLMVGFFCV